MTFVRLLPVIFAAVLFAAHTMRFMGLFPALVVLALLLTLFIRRIWILRLWQILTAFAIVEWVRTTIMFVQVRIAVEMPYGRLLIIMIAVILFNIYAIVSLQNKKLQRFYSGKQKSDG